MPDGTLALSIPGLFLTCVQYFTLIRLGRDFEADFGSCILQLRTVEIRLQRWGTSVGITNDESDEFEKLEERDDSGDIKFALEQISTQLSRAHQDSQAIVKRNRDPNELALIDEARQLDLSDAKVSQASRVQAKLKSSYQKSFDLTSRVVGNAISQAGNNYGFSSLPVYNNQGSNVVPPAPKPDAQPGNGVR